MQPRSQLAVVDETGETLVLTSESLQLWSVNGTLLACTHDPFPSAPTALTLLHTPEWMVEQLPIAATGHADGTISFWTVREPAEGAALRQTPRALSSLPVPAAMQPTWDLAEVVGLRLDPRGPAPGSASASAGGVAVGNRSSAIMAIAPGEGFERLLWSATADGRLRSWKAPAVSSGSTAAPKSSNPASHDVLGGEATAVADAGEGAAVMMLASELGG